MLADAVDDDDDSGINWAILDTAGSVKANIAPVLGHLIRNPGCESFGIREDNESNG